MPLTVDWYPDFWTKEERDELFNFWRERYFSNAIYLSPSRDVCGGIGFFDSLLFSLHHKSERDVSNDLHPVNKSFKLRYESLMKQKEISQEADRKRLQLLMLAEKAGWEWWQNKMIYQITGTEPDYLIEFYESYIEKFEVIYKDSLAQLIEYDREYGNPLSDPNRNFEKQPISISENRRWLSRKGRLLLENTPDDIFIKQEWKKLTNKDIQYIIPAGTTFIPEYLSERQSRRITEELNKGIVRNKSGVVISDKNNKRKLRPAMPLILSRLGDLADRISNFKNIQDDARPDIEKVEIELESINEEKYSFANPPPLPDGNPYLIDNGRLFKDIEIVEENNDIIEPNSDQKFEDFNASAIDIVSMSNEIKAMVERIEKENIKEEDNCSTTEDEDSIILPREEEVEIQVYPHKIENENHIEEEIENSDNLEENNEEEKSKGKSKSGGEEPEWMKERSFDGKNKKNPLDFDPSTMFAPGVFERNKRLDDIINSWQFKEKNKKNLEKNEIEKEQPETHDFWGNATKKVSNFKGKAISLWKRKIAPTLGLETAERRAITKIKNQELRHLQKIIQKLENKQTLDVENKETIKPKVYKPKM